MILQVSLVSKSPVHLISRSQTTIKPASPTPLNLKQYNLPLHDGMMPNIYMPLIYFYQNLKALPDKTTISNLLMNSLSETLSVYYPFAGRLMSGFYVECNDEGVPFVEAEIGCKLSQFLEKAPIKDEEGDLGHLFPPRSIWTNVSYPSLLLVQLNHFTCGGIAIAVSLFHRIADGATLVSFLKYWSSLLQNSLDHKKQLHLCPHFAYELQLPQLYDNNLVATNDVYPEKNWITKEIVFRNSKIAKLKATPDVEDKRHGVANQHYSKSELVAALLYKSAVVATASNSAGIYSKSVLFEIVNVRRLIYPRLPNTSVGNFICLNDIPTSTESEATKLNLLVKRMRKGKMQLRGIKNLVGRETMPLIENYTKNQHKLYAISSICGFLVYDVMDFGWGRPVKATVVDTPFVNFMFLMDIPSVDGVSAIVGLEEEDMKILQFDKDLLTYASFLTVSS